MRHLRFLFAIFAMSFLLVLQLPLTAKAQITPSDESRALRDLSQTQQQQENFIKNLQTEQERQIREKKKPTVEVPGLEEEAAPENKKSQQCFNMQTIEFKGATILQAHDKEKLTAKYLDHKNACMGIIEINKLMHDLTNYYVDKGYVTTRVAIPQQDLKSGNLQLLVIEGTVEDIILNENSWRDRAQIAMAFPFMKGKLLNLRDIEQGLDQLNRLSSSTATMQLVPGDKQGGTKVIITNKPTKQNRGTLGYDNSGQSSTGKNKGSASFERDNLFGIGESWSFNLTEDTAANRGTKNSEVYTGSFSLPFGYWTFSENASHSEYLQTNTGTNETFQASGQTDSSTSKLERVVYRNQDSKLSLNTSLKLKDTKAFIEDAASTSGTYSLSIGTIGFDYTLRALNAVWNFASNYEHGLTIFDATHDSSSIASDSPHAQFNKYTVDASFYKPFAIKTANFTLRSTVSGQYSKDTLYSSEQIFIGDRYTVRGFGETSLGGDSGVYNRNEISWNAPQLTENKYANFFIGNLQPYIGVDLGTARAAIGKTANSNTGAGYMSGWATGIRNSTDYLSFDLSYAEAIKSPAFITPKNNEVYFTVSAKFGF